MKILTAAEMREVDRLTTERHSIASLTLMENAGHAIAAFIRERFSHLERRRIVILCGKGNNGGDGLVLARHLRQMDANPSVYLFASPDEMRGDAATNLKRWQAMSGELHVIENEDDWNPARQVLRSAGIIVDALLGTGVRGPVEGLLRTAIREINQKNPWQEILAVDIPSGLPADTGEVSEAVVVADHTVTLTAPKVGMVLGQVRKVVGQLLVRDIGSPRELIEELGRSKLRWSEAGEFSHFALPRKPEGHKGSYGHALIVAGSVGKTGAAVLASWSALRVGAGLVTVATPEPALPIIATHTPEVMTEPLPATNAGTISLRTFDASRFDAVVKGKQAIGLGPGLTTNDETQEFVRRVLAQRTVPIVLDADGLNAFAGRAAELNNSNRLLVVTPHPGEMARLVGCETQEVQANRLEIARRSAAEWNACVVLKGHQTVVASPSGDTFINSTGNPGMGTGGTGDVLTGMLAGLVAQFGHDLDYAAFARLVAFGVYLHGLAGDIAYAERGEAPLIASDVIQAIARAYQRFYAECGRG